MMLLSLFDTEPETPAQPVSLRVLPAPDDSSDVRIIHPHVGESGDLQAIFAEMRADHSDPLPQLTDAELIECRKWWPLHRIYETYLAAWRDRQRRAGKVTLGTLQKERQSLRCFQRWDADPSRAPAAWPGGIKWAGLPVGHLAQKYCEGWLRSRLEQGYSEPTMQSRWNHVRTVLNLIRQMGVIGDIPTVDYTAVAGAFALEAGTMAAEDLVPTTYTPEQLAGVYRLIHEADLRAAWVLGFNCGPRTVDLFTLTWPQIRLGDRPELLYRARKTGKRHWVPLHPFTVRHLRRLIALQGHLDPTNPDGPVFPRLTSRAADPERSTPARRRNWRIKSILGSIGLPVAANDDYDKPWQVLRSTCNSTLNNHRPGAGALVTHGKDLDVSSQHYWNHFPLVAEAIQTMPIPAIFGEI